MTDHLYRYSIQNDFPNHKVAPDRLFVEIEAEIANSRIQTGYENADDCDIWFGYELDEEEQTLLDSIVAEHSGESIIDYPSGHSVICIPEGSARWERFKYVVQFPKPMDTVPTSIELSNVLFSGSSGLQIEEKMAYGFMVSAKSIGRGNQLGPNCVEFDWEVTA